jgi:ATP-dependent Clp protease, protease subunit
MNAEILIYETIGEDFFGGGMSAKRFHDELKALGNVEEITIRINSPGGSVFDGDAIYNALARHPAKVIAEIDGLAASAASYIAMAADEIRMAENALMMIHNGQGVTIGDKRDHAKMIELLGKIDGTIANIYAKRSGRRPETFAKLMDEETWFTAQEAVENKLADTVLPSKKVAARFDPRALSNFKHAPDLSRLFEDHRPPAEEIKAKLARLKGAA